MNEKSRGGTLLRQKMLPEMPRPVTAPTHDDLKHAANMLREVLAGTYRYDDMFGERVQARKLLVAAIELIDPVEGKAGA